MTMPRWLGAVCILAVSAMVPVAASAASAKLPSVVLITFDTTRADHLSCYRYFRDTSPNIDTLARDGVLFENAVTPIAVTLPAHVSLLTGTTPLRHHVRGNFGSFHPSPTAPDRLRSATEIFGELGYQTAAFVSSAAVKSATGISIGFDTFDQPQVGSRIGEETTDHALRWLRGRAAGATGKSAGGMGKQPVFLWVHYWDPHSPYSPPGAFATRYTTSPQLVAFLKEHTAHHPEDAFIQKLNNLYDGEIRYADTQLGRLLDALKQIGLYDDSVIVVAGDHGEGLGQHYEMYHEEIFNEQLFVPLIIKFPKRLGLKGQRRKALTSLIDVLPTVVAAVHLPVPEEEQNQFEGVNALETNGRTEVLCDRVPPRNRPQLPFPKHALMSLDWKYFYRPHGRDELYDMRSDRAETRNLVTRRPRVAAAMRGRIITRLASYGPGATGPLETTKELPPEVQEQLRSLGY